MTTNNSHKKYYNQTYGSVSRSVQVNFKPIKIFLVQFPTPMIQKKLRWHVETKSYILIKLFFSKIMRFQNLK